MKVYAGIGSRNLPGDIPQMLKFVASGLDADGWKLRSGGAKGADQAFESGAKHPTIFMPAMATPEAIEVASEYHPAWDKCTEYVREFMGRNVQIILGRGLDEPVEFVVCWTTAPPDRGGTNFGLRVARANGIPTYNLSVPQERHRFGDSFAFDFQGFVWL